MSENVKDEVAIRNLVENWASTVRRKDLDAILLNHSPDMLMFDVPPPLESKGLEAYKKTWDLFFSWAHDPVKSRVCCKFVDGMRFAQLMPCVH